MTSIAEKKEIIGDFIARCNEYAEAQLKKYQAQLDKAQEAPNAPNMEALDIETKIYHWKVYRAFNAYTIEELKTGELDPWFDERQPALSSPPDK